MSRSSVLTIISVVSLGILTYAGFAGLWRKVISPRGEVSWLWFLILYLLFGVCAVFVVPTIAAQLSSSSENAPATTPSFRASLDVVLNLRYPGVLFYVYDSSQGALIAPVGIAAMITVVNMRSSLAEITDYALDAQVGGEWVHLPTLPALNPDNFFWAMNGDLRQSRRLDFRAMSFDAQAHDRNLASGESLRGWTFFEWPPALRQSSNLPTSFRLALRTSDGERQSIPLSPPSPGTHDTSSLGGGYFSVLPGPATDLSGHRIVPYTDLIQNRH